MDRLKTKEELRDFRTSLQDAAAYQEKELKIIDVKIGMGTCGLSAGADKTLTALAAEAEARGITNIIFTQTGCMGYCHSEPTVTVKRPGEEPLTFGNVKPENVKALFDSYIQNGVPADGLIPLASYVVR